jgi:hypothetical protein
VRAVQHEGESDGSKDRSDEKICRVSMRSAALQIPKARRRSRRRVWDLWKSSKQYCEQWYALLRRDGSPVLAVLAAAATGRIQTGDRRPAAPP